MLYPCEKFLPDDQVHEIKQLTQTLEIFGVKYFHLYGVTIKSVDAIDTQIADGDGSAIEVKVVISYTYYRTEGSDVVYSE